MYDSITEFIKTFSADHRLLWALLVTAVVACISLVLFLFWETALRLYPPTRASKINGKRPSRS